MEDPAIYRESWIESFRSSIPVDYGMSFASITFPQESSFNETLQELKDDLLLLNDAVLVARGPLSSWRAQFYLESFSLKGLIMVDPALLEKGVFGGHEAEAIAKLQEHSGDGDGDGDGNGDGDGDGRGGTSSGDLERACWNDLFRGAQERRLLLEPDVVPMLVLHTHDNAACERSVVRVAERHSGDEGSRFGDVTVRPVPQGDNNERLMTEIDEWIESIL